RPSYRIRSYSKGPAEARGRTSYWVSSRPCIRRQVFRRRISARGNRHDRAFAMTRRPTRQNSLGNRYHYHLPFAMSGGDCRGNAMAEFDPGFQVELVSLLGRHVMLQVSVVYLLHNENWPYAQ